jgi:exopolysaccharide biosynthesis polyprenyl glycosylphosphotransferase
LAADLVAFLLLYGLALAIREMAILGSPVANAVNKVLPTDYLGGWRFTAALFIGLLATRNYGQGNRRRDPARILGGVLLATGLSLWQNIWSMGLPRVGLQFAITATGFWIALVGARRSVDWLVRWARRKTGEGERVLLVGDPEDPKARKVESCLVDDGMIIAGWVACPSGSSEDRPAVPVEDVWQALEQREVDVVVIAGHPDEELFHRVAEASSAAGCRILFYPILNGAGDLKPSVSWHRSTPFIELGLPGLRLWHLMLKRSMDVMGSALLLVLLSPLLLLAAVLIKLDSRGPVFFVQDRVGLGGKPFQLVKFRTMRNGADVEKANLAHLNRTGDPRLFKIPNDPRVTRVGAWLRRWSVDELPQLWNVLKGEMSLVGPRPFPLSDLSGYQDHHFLRLTMRPGITGLWQVEGRSDIVDFEKVVQLDRQYIERWSIWLDLAIIAKTIPAVIKRSGAY